MTRTGYEAEEFEVPGQQAAGPAGVARGYRRSPGGWSEVAFDPAGAFAPMGGIFSCVRDLTRWVAGFAAAFPPGAATTATHPVRRASRREMQLPQVLTGWAIAPSFPGDGASSPPATYGFGLFVDEHPALGRIVSHSGGYPGFGSNMAWHPATGTGVIALGNSTYAAMAPLAARLLEAVVRQGEPGRPREQRGARLAGSLAGDAGRPRGGQQAAPGRGTTPRRSGCSRPTWRMDAPFEERRRRIALVRERIGEFGDDPGRQPEFDTPAQCRWWLAGERGTVQVQIQLNPERPPRVQSLTLAVPPAAGSALRVTLDAVVDWLNGGERDWPPSIPVADGVDTGLLARRLRMAAALGGPLPRRRRQGGRRHRLGRGRTGRRARHHHAGPGHRPGNPPAPPGRRRPVSAVARARQGPQPRARIGSAICKEHRSRTSQRAARADAGM